VNCGLRRTVVIGPTLPPGLKRISKVHASVFNRSAILWQAASLALWREIEIVNNEYLHWPGKIGRIKTRFPTNRKNHET
jgi:hypothetical protein